MRSIAASALAVAICLLPFLSPSLTGGGVGVAWAKKPSRTSRPPPAAAGRRRPSTARRSSGRTTGAAAAAAPRRPAYEEEDEYDEQDDDDEGYDDVVAEAALLESFDEDGDLLEEEEVDVVEVVRPATSSRKRAAPPSAGRLSRERSTRSARRPPPSGSRRARPAPRSRYGGGGDDDDFDDGYTPRRSQPRRGPPPRGGPARRGPGGRSVVPYTKPGAASGAASAFMRGLSSAMGALPDPATVKDAAVSGITAARQTTSSLSSNIYREVKGLTSSELEQVMLKATRPDDTAVKGKHVERLVGVTYQISARYDIYDAVLRKLWSKMAEKDWRTTIKAVYILHRFSADGAPEHAPALKARLRELRRTRDPKRKDKYFNSKQLLAGDSNPENIKHRAFMSRYAHYVLLRAQSFGGMFDEISHLPKPDKKRNAPPKPITSTCLRAEYLNAAGVLLKAGVVCQLKDGEECENTAIASERVASDMIGLTTAVAIALNRALKDGGLKGADPALLNKWCVFYSEDLLPQTKAMVKKLSPKLDAYGLFLPSRMGASVSPDLLEKGLHLEEGAEEEEEDSTTPAEPVESGDASGTDQAAATAAMEVDVEKPRSSKVSAAAAASVVEEEEESDAEDEAVEEEAEFDEEYEYEEEEYYDDEE